MGGVVLGRFEGGGFEDEDILGWGCGQCRLECLCRDKTFRLGFLARKFASFIRFLVSNPVP